MHRLFNYIYIYLIPLFFSAFFSLRTFRLKWPKYFKVFSVFLILTLFTEAFAIAWKWELHKTEYWSYRSSNLWIYNTFVIVRHFFMLFFFYHIISQELIKKLIRLSALPFFIFSVLNYIFFQSPHTINSYTFIISNIALILLSLSFFRQILRDDKIIRLSSSPEAWICLGTFVYYSGTLPFFMLFNYLLARHPPIAYSYLYINDSLNIIMYTLYLICFLCKPPYQK